MGWKDWPYWLKGGIIFVCYSILISLILILVNYLFISNYSFSFNYLGQSLIFPGPSISFLLSLILGSIYIGVLWFLQFILPIYGEQHTPQIIFIFTPIISAFVIGSCLGAIYGFVDKVSIGKSGSIKGGIYGYLCGGFL